MTGPSRRLTRRAGNDLRSIGLYSAKYWGKAQGKSYVDALGHRFDWLAANPQAGQQRDDLMAGVRSYPEGSHVIFYRTEGHLLVVLTIRHHAQDVPALRDLQ